MQFDVIIVGGGMVGASLAYALSSSSSLRIALIDSTPKTIHDPRLIALNHNSFRFYENLSIWSDLVEVAEPILAVHVSHRGRFGRVKFSSEDLNLHPLGFVVPAYHINEALYKKLSSVTLFCPATLKNIQTHEDMSELEIKLPNETLFISGKIIVGADGTHSTVRKLLQFKTHEMDYQQSALVTITQLKRSHEGIAYERFTKEGAIAMLPLVADHSFRVATIWTERTATINQLQQLEESAFIDELQRQFGLRLGKLIGIKERHVFPLHSIWVENTVKHNVILIGNAAHTLHPIAAQGLNLALWEVALLVSQLQQSHFQLSSLQSRTHKISYYLSHYLSRFFSADFFIMNQLRQFGLLAMDLNGSLKKYVSLNLMNR